MAYSLFGHEQPIYKIRPGHFNMFHLNYIIIRLSIVQHTLTANRLSMLFCKIFLSSAISQKVRKVFIWELERSVCVFSSEISSALCRFIQELAIISLRLNAINALQKRIRKKIQKPLYYICRGYFYLNLVLDAMLTPTGPPYILRIPSFAMSIKKSIFRSMNTQSRRVLKLKKQLLLI